MSSEPQYRAARPGHALIGQVALFWSLSAPATGEPDRICPDGRCEIILHRARPPRERRGEGQTLRQPQRFLYGPMTGVLTLEADAPLDFYAIRLEPWAVGLLGPSPTNWRDRAVDLDELAPKLSARLAEIVRSGPSIEAFGEYAETALLEAFKPFAAMRDASQAVTRLENDDDTTIPDLARSMAMSARTLSRRMERATGLSARAFQGLVRFHHARTAIKAGAESLSNVAADCGYADQAHMTREFRRFSGETPRLIRQPAIFDAVYE